MHPRFSERCFAICIKPFFRPNLNNHVEFSQLMFKHDCQSWESRNKLPREKGLSIKEFEKYLVKSPTFKDMLYSNSEIFLPRSIVPTTYPPCRSSS